MALATTGITTSAVGNALGTSSRSVSALCTHSNINKWSKKKPVEISSATPNRSSNWYIGDNGCCGFKQDTIYFTNVGALITAYNNNATYQYQPPTGYKRLADFGGYEHNAKCPIYSVDVEGIIYADSTSSNIAVTVNMNTDVNTNTNLLLNDLIPSNLVDVDEAYFGCIISYGGRYYIKTNSEKIGSTDALNFYYVEVKGSEFSTVGTHKIYPVISTKPYTSLTTSMSGTRFIAIPKGTGGTFETSFTVQSSSMAGSIVWYNAWYSQAAKLTMGGTLSYKKSFEGSSVGLVFYKTVNGTRKSVGNRTITLSHTGTNGSEAYTMDFEYKFTQSTESGSIYYIDATLGTYTVTAECDEGNPLM